MHRSIYVLPLILLMLSTSVSAQSSISIVGRVVDANQAPLSDVNVTLGIAKIANPRDRIVSDESNPFGLFQLAKSTVGNFSELYLWIEEPYAYKPKLVTAVKTDMWRQKIDDIILNRTLVGSIPPDEAAERVAAIFAIEQLKAKLKIQDSTLSSKRANEIATGVLARCENIQKKGTLDSVVSNAAKIMNEENALFSESKNSLLALSSRKDFIQLAKANQKNHTDIEIVLSAYLKGEKNYSKNIDLYVNGINPTAIKPEWFAGGNASKHLWANLQPKSENQFNHSFVVGSLKTGTIEPQLTSLKAGGLYVDIKKPPKTEDIKRWFKGNPDNSKSLMKALILADPNLTAYTKTEINKNIKAVTPIVVPNK